MTPWAERYLRLLGLEVEPPGLGWLRRFGIAHLRAVPFCNLTAIARRHATSGDTVPPVNVEAQLDTWEQRTGGGVCFEVAEMVHGLLAELGYQTHVVLGLITFPGSHQAVVVRLPEGPYLIDLGCGAPLSEPIPLVRDSEYHVAGLGYRFRPDLGAMVCVQDRLIEGEWTEFCRYDLRPASEEDREDGYQRHHIPGETWVVGSLTLVRCFEDSVVSMREGSLTRFRDGEKRNVEITDDAGYRMLAQEELFWPELPIADALAMLRELRTVSKPANSQP